MPRIFVGLRGKISKGVEAEKKDPRRSIYPITVQSSKPSERVREESRDARLPLPFRKPVDVYTINISSISKLRCLVQNMSELAHDTCVRIAQYHFVDGLSPSQISQQIPGTKQSTILMICTRAKKRAKSSAIDQILDRIDPTPRSGPSGSIFL